MPTLPSSAPTTMRILSTVLLSALSTVSLLAFNANAQDEPAKPATEASGSKDAPSPTKTAEEPKTEKKQDSNNRANNKKADKPNQETDPAAKKEKTQQKPVKPPPPEKKPITHIGSLKNPPIPGQPWRIHDIRRPHPKVVTPGVIDTMPPADAMVLFNGENLNEWYHLGGEDEIYEAQWKVHDGYFEVEPRTGSMNTFESFGSCQLHIEWFIPEGTTGTSQGRGNSGIKLMERYEVQILDSYKSRTYADGQAGSIYGQYPPLVNAVRQQGEWQTYDIIFEAPIYEAGKMKQPPFITLTHNGILVHHHRELTGPTGLRSGAQEVVPPSAPLSLQDHGNRIRFRNIWIRPL